MEVGRIWPKFGTEGSSHDSSRSIIILFSLSIYLLFSYLESII